MNTEKKALPICCCQISQKGKKEREKGNLNLVDYK
jgi:hypothetical protein